jgi:hypothetical protein
VTNEISSSLKSEIRALRAALRSLESTLQRVIETNGASTTVPRSRPHLSPKARASLVLQGRYMGYMRQLKPRQKAQVRRIRERKGVRAAIVRARELGEA